MRKTPAIVAAAGAMLSTAAQAAVPPTTPEGWRAAADRDLTAVHDLLRDNSPAPLVDRDSARFRQWLEAGLAQARANLPKVTDGRGYIHLMNFYARGFRDSHIQVGQTDDSKITTRALAWPGFVVGWKDGGYEVRFKASDVAYGPPVHARLVACDGMTPAQIDRRRDLYDGDLALESGRAFSATRMFLDRGNPMAPPLKACAFRWGSTTQSFPLQWQPLSDRQSAEFNAALRGPPRGKLGLAPWGDGRFWITIPSMEAGQDWNGFYDQVRANLAKIRAADAVVIDLRGNGGGDSSFGNRLARILWGRELVDAKEPWLGPTVWRVSKLNRDHWASLVEDVSKNPSYDADTVRELREILTAYDDALAKGEATFRLGRETPPSRTGVAWPNPVKGRVVLLTDYACNSACLDLMDLFTALPGVVQAGTPTDADTIFMELTLVPALPSGMSGLGFGHKAWVKRPRGSNQPYVPAPALTWRGDLGDEAGLKAWLANAIGGEAPQTKTPRR